MILITDIISSPVGHALLQLLLSQKEHEPVRVDGNSLRQIEP